MIAALFLFALGTFLVWVGWRHWRYRNEDTISLLEAAILKTTGVEPMSRKRIDRFLTYVQAVCGFLFGTFFLIMGLLAVLNQWGAL